MAKDDIWNLTKEHDQKRHEEAYRKGQEDAEEAGLLDEVFHGIEDIIGTVVPGETTEHKSYEKGWHDKKEGK